MVTCNGFIFLKGMNKYSKYFSVLISNTVSITGYGTFRVLNTCKSAKGET